MPTQPACLDDRLRKGDAKLFSVFGHPVTINEAHAAILGLVGVLLGERSFAIKTIKHEPHYFVGVFVIGYIVARRVID